MIHRLSIIASGGVFAGGLLAFAYLSKRKQYRSVVKGPQGAECVRWNTKEKKWESKWTRSDVSSVSMIPAVSIKSEMVFVCGWNDASGWEITEVL